MRISNMKTSTKDVALLVVFSALSVIIIKIFPGIPIVGVPGSNIKFDAAVAPVYGIVIGPYLGFTAALIGGFVTAGSPFSILTSFSPAISAMIAGFLTSERLPHTRGKFPGWMVAAVLLAALIAGWYLTPIGWQAPLYPILHIAGLLGILITRNWVARSFRKINLDTAGWHFRSSVVLLGVILAVAAFMFSKPFIGEEVLLLPHLSVPLYIVAEIVILYGIFGRGRVSYLLLGVIFTICGYLSPQLPLNMGTSVSSILSVVLYVTAQVVILYGIFGEGRFSLISSIFLACYCGIIADHMLGNLIFIGVIDILIPLADIQQFFLQPLGLPNIPSLFMYMLPVSAIERILMTIAATIFGISLFIALYKTGLLERVQQLVTHHSVENKQISE